MAQSMKTVSHAIDRLLATVVVSKTPVIVTFDGEEYHVTVKMVQAMRDRENTYNSKDSKVSKKSKTLSLEARERIISHLDDKISHSMSHLGFKVPVNTVKFVNDSLHASHVSKKLKLKMSSATLRILFITDDYLNEFIDGLVLDLLSLYVDKKGSASIRDEITKFEHNLNKSLTGSRAGASTVINALLIMYTKIAGLRVKEGELKSYIKMDSRVKKLIEAPMNSTFRGKSYAKEYIAKTPTKKTGKGDEMRTVTSLAGYRAANPSKSVANYLMESFKNHEYLNDGFFKNKDMMSIISAHLIPKIDGVDVDLSMKMVNGNYVNPTVHTLIAYQSLLTASNATVDMVPARVPARSPSRSVSRSPSRSVSRSKRGSR